MEHQKYIEKVIEERKIRDEQRKIRLLEEEKQLELKKQQLEESKLQQLKELQDSRRLQSKLNVSNIHLKSDERTQKIKEQNRRVKQLLEQFRLEKLEQESQIKQIQEQKEEEIKQKLQQIKERFKLMNINEIQEHQLKYQKYQHEHQQQIEIMQEQKRQQDSIFMNQIHSRLRSRTYQTQLQMMKEQEQQRREQLEKQKKQIKERFAYDSFVKEHFLPKISQSIDLTSKTINNMKSQADLSPVRSDPRALGNLYLRQIRRLPKRPRIQSQVVVESSSSSIRRDYLSELRQNSKKKTPKTPFDIKFAAERLEQESKQAYTRNKLKGDRLLLDSIKQKMLLLEL